MKFSISFACLTILSISVAQAADPLPSMEFNAGRHAKMGVTCEMCHGEKLKIAEPKIEQCTTCHQTDQLVKKTQPKSKTGQNPHMSPHYQDKLECTNCHFGHQEPDDFCAQCHQFNFKVK